MTYVLLPVSRAAYEEIAEQVRLRGQPERVDKRSLQITLADVVLVADEDALLTEESAKALGYLR